MGARGKAVMANEVRPCGVPRRRFGYFAAVGKVTRRPQTAEPPAKTYGASMILGPQIFFHPRHPT